MMLDEYQQEARRTAPRPLDAYPYAVRAAAAELEIKGKGEVAKELLRTFDQLIWCLGLAGEVGEALDLIKKHLGHGQALDREKLKKEFGDCRWYSANLEDSFGFKSSEVAAANVEKLWKRFPSGFTVADSAAKKDEQSK